jgi:hypothetical protein
LAFLQSFSEFVLYSKLWQLERFPESHPTVAKVIDTFKETDREKYYWRADTLIKEKADCIQYIKRKFRLP